jgi:hypothetical protein
MKLSKMKLKLLRAYANHQKEEAESLQAKMLKKIIERKREGKKFTPKHLMK